MVRYGSHRRPVDSRVSEGSRGVPPCLMEAMGPMGAPLLHCTWRRRWGPVGCPPGARCPAGPRGASGACAPRCGTYRGGWAPVGGVPSWGGSRGVPWWGPVSGVPWVGSRGWDPVGAEGPIEAWDPVSRYCMRTSSCTKNCQIKTSQPKSSRVNRTSAVCRRRQGKSTLVA